MSIPGACDGAGRNATGRDRRGDNPRCRQQGVPRHLGSRRADEANASRTTFYKHFGDKRECFLAAYDLAVERILGVTEAACEHSRRWSDRARSGLAAVVELFAADPALARMAIVEASAAGTEARRRHWATIDRFAHLLEPDPRQQRYELPPGTALMAIGAVLGLILDELREGRVANLQQILPDLEFALLVPYLGPRAATESLVETPSI